MTDTVPNEFPSIACGTSRIALIGEAPGEEEVSKHRPFVGVSGKLLDKTLQAVGVTRQQCFVGNVCQHRPPGNKIEMFDWRGSEIQSGLSQLKEDLNKFSPNICVLLGNSPLHAFHGAPVGIQNWRGSIFNSDEWKRKCIAALHPAFCLRSPENRPLLMFDLLRAKQHSDTPTFEPPHRDLLINLPPDQILERLATLLRTKQPFAFDLEGGEAHISCLSIATSPWECLSIPFDLYPEYEQLFWNALRPLLEDSSIKKTLQNALYEMHVLWFNQGIMLRGIEEDGMIKHWELYSELPKTLAFQCSIYTLQPYYKGDRLAQDKDKFYRYNCLDSVINLESVQVMEPKLSEAGRANYKRNIQLLDVLAYMQRRGWNYDVLKRQQRLIELGEQQKVLQAKIDAAVDKYYGPIKGKKTPKHAQDEQINIESNKQMCEYLYQTRKFKVRLNNDDTPSANEEALLSIAREKEDAVVLDMLELRRLGTRIQNLQWNLSKDGRMRFSYNLIGTKTGRISCSKFLNDDGGNGQTITEEDRDLYRADEGYTLGSYDLSGADGWTVAAHSANLGDFNMLDDLKAGIKIPKVIALAFNEGPHVLRLPRLELKELCKKIDGEDPIYFGAKKTQHSANYLAGKITLLRNIFKDSDGKINLTGPQTDLLKQLYFTRYPGVMRWHKAIEKQIMDKGYVLSGNGHKHIFFGSPKDTETLRSALSSEPQNNTTYLTNSATLKLWLDPENRHEDGSHIIQPLHTIHDALVVQIPTDRLEWGKAKMATYFDNTLTIAGQQIKIPYGEKYGPNWRDMK